ncbi:hypothetical protein [Mesorhizobium sp. 10J20-29]
MIACRGAIRGSAHTAFARRALVAAAFEVGILAGD